MRLRYFILLSLLVVALAVIPYSDIVKPPEFDFDISVEGGISPSYELEVVRLPVFAELECTVTVALTRGFAQPVSLTLSGFPDDTPVSYSYEFSPASGVPPFSSTLKITARESFSGEKLELTIVGTGGGKTNSAIMFVQMHIDDDVR